MSRLADGIDLSHDSPSAAPDGRVVQNQAKWIPAHPYENGPLQGRRHLHDPPRQPENGEFGARRNRYFWE